MYVSESSWINPELAGSLYVYDDYSCFVRSVSTKLCFISRDKTNTVSVDGTINVYSLNKCIQNVEHRQNQCCRFAAPSLRAAMSNTYTSLVFRSPPVSPPATLPHPRLEEKRRKRTN